MISNKLFPNQPCEKPICKHKKLPIYKTDEFDFYRCVEFNNSFYGKTVSELHSGNLRERNREGRYSFLFPYKKISYWASDKKTALAEFKYHYGIRDVLTFWVYDDATSTFPTTNNDEPLYIIDGREFGFHEILDKYESGSDLSEKDNEIIQKIAEESPDCLAYCSKRNPNGVNFLFFEKGFRKLSVREVGLLLRSRTEKNKNTIFCAYSSDYSPRIDAYGQYFSPIAKIKTDISYFKTEEYLFRKSNLENLYKSGGDSSGE